MIGSGSGTVERCSVCRPGYQCNTECVLWCRVFAAECAADCATSLLLAALLGDGVFTGDGDFTGDTGSAAGRAGEAERDDGADDLPAAICPVALTQ